MIHVCPLSKLSAIVAASGARHVASLLNAGTAVSLPAEIMPSNHLFLAMNDIVEATPGMTLPGEAHVTALLSWLEKWERVAPVVIHCYAGISRSTAAAFIAVCALNPREDEEGLAHALRRRAPSATPNRRLVAVADAVLGRQGRMMRAIDAIGRGEDAFEGVPFRLDLASVNA